MAELSEEERKLGERLTMAADGVPTTQSGEVGCVMRLFTSQIDDVKLFRYRPDFFSEVFEVEWPADTMVVVLPADVGHYLISAGYARPMTAVEIDEYNKETKS